MILSTSVISDAAEALFMAEQNRTQIGILSQQHPSMTMEDAYAIQNALKERKLAARRSIIGWKIGLTSKAMQQALGLWRERRSDG